MSKKIPEVMAKEKGHFVEGCAKNNIDRDIAEQIWDEMEDFAKYAFNKAHAVAYATIGYQTAWLKTHYPAEFMAALLTSVMDNMGKVAEYIGECKKMELEVLPPDINHSFGDFTVFEDGKISFGLNAIKHLGKPTVAALVRQRQRGGHFKNLTEFISRLDDGEINKKSLESLVKAGGLASLGGKRSQYAYIYEDLLANAAASKRANMAGQMSLLDIAAEDEISLETLPNISEFTLEKILGDEKEVLGIYVSGHPVLAYAKQLDAAVNAYSRDFAQGNTEINDGQKVAVGGIISKKNVVYTRATAAAMCFLTIEDIYGSFEVIIFPKIYQNISTEIYEGRGVLVYGKFSLREDENSTLAAEKIEFLEKDATATLWLKIAADSNQTPENLLKILANYAGTTPVNIYDEKTKKTMKVKRNFWVNSASGDMMRRLKDALGEDAVVLK